MAILDILSKPMFSSHFKLPLYILTSILVIIVIGLSVPQLFMKNQPRTRPGTIALGMGAKSLILLIYMLATENIQRLRKWQSYRANIIINCLEIVFWGAVAFLVLQGNLSRCEGVTCYLSWVVVAIAVVINLFEFYASAIAIREFHDYRKMRDSMIQSSVVSCGTDEKEMVQGFPNQSEDMYQGWSEERRAAPQRYHAQVVCGK